MVPGKMSRILALVLIIVTQRHEPTPNASKRGLLFFPIPRATMHTARYGALDWEEGAGSACSRHQAPHSLSLYLDVLEILAPRRSSQSGDRPCTAWGTGTDTLPVTRPPLG